MSLTGVKKNYLIIDTFLSLIGTLLWKVSRKTGIAKHGGTDLQHCSQFNPVSVRIFLMYSEVDRTLSTKKYTNMIIINQKMIILGRCGLPRPGTQKPSPTQSHNHAFSLMENEARWWLAPNLVWRCARAFQICLSRNFGLCYDGRKRKVRSPR